MRSSIFTVTAFLFAAGIVLGPGRALSAQDEKKDGKKGSEEEAPASIQSGPEHEVLKQFVGHWDAKMSMMTAPGAPPQESEGTETNTLGCGGLWLISDFKGKLMEMPYHGHGIQGWDAEKKKYVGVWVDNHTMRIDISEATYDAAAKTLTAKSKGKDPQSGAEYSYTMKTVFHDKEHRTMSVLAPISPDPTAGESEVMKISYTRRKSRPEGAAGVKVDPKVIKKDAKDVKEKPSVKQPEKSDKKE